jgi:hypothetical protein
MSSMVQLLHCSYLCCYSFLWSFLSRSESVLILITCFYLYWIMKRKWRLTIPSISTKQRTTSCFWTQKKPRYLTMEIKVRLNNWITNVNTDCYKQWNTYTYSLLLKRSHTIIDMKNILNMNRTITGSTNARYDLPTKSRR